jgi:molybdopterin molybdotransferase
MISVQDEPWYAARSKAAQGWQVLARELVPIAEGAGRTLAVNCSALCDLPMYATSAMDGYAVAGSGPWQIVGEVKAGQPMITRLAGGTCVAIATGAVIPAGTFGVMRWESAEVVDSYLHGSVSQGKDIRPAANECKKGENLARVGTVLNPGWLGFLAAAGYDEVLVFKKPRVELLLLGDEIALSGIPHDGFVRDALGPQLPGWLMRMGAEVISMRYVADEIELVIAAIGEAIQSCDFVVTTGGTAGGPRDHLHSAVSALSGELVVDRVKVRPGHPMLLAWIVNHRGIKIPLLGLPGNPQSAIAALLTLGQPVVDSLLGRHFDVLDVVPTANEITSPADFTRLVLGNIVGGSFEMGEYLGSAMLRGLAHSSGFAVAGSGVTKIGTQVGWLPLP